MIGMKLVDEGLTRRERRKEETRQRIIQAALSLLSEKPYDEITVEDITERADVAKGTFFHYFPNKELVLSGHVENLLDEVREFLQEIRPEERDSQWEVLLEIMRYVANQDAKTPVFVRTHLAACCANAELRQRMKALGEEAVYECAQGIACGQERGEFRTDVPAEVMGHHIMQIYRMCLFEWAMKDGQLPFADMLEQTLEFFKPAFTNRR